MKTSRRNTLFGCMLKPLLVMTVALTCGTVTGEEANENKDEFTLEEITVTAQFQETNLQRTPIAISALTGETLEERNIQSITDLGLVIPNSAIREQGNAWGPNSYIGLRGVDQSDFIPAFEPGVVVYVDDVFNETVVGSTMDLVDLERVEVLRGPQGTLFGKNSIGGAIRLISKTPMGDNTGHIQVTYGDYHRLDFTAGYDFALIDDLLFTRISASSKRIDGYMDRLDFVCQMNANDTPELAGTLPPSLRDYDLSQGNCKIGEKGGSQSDAAKLMLRYLPSHKLEFNMGLDYTKIVSDTGATTLLRGADPNPTLPWDVYAEGLYQAQYGISPFGDQYVTGSPFAVYETFEDPIKQIRWPDKVNQDYTNFFLRADYDITDDIHAKFIYGYRKYNQVFTTVNYTPFSFNAYLIDMRHHQDSYELRLTGKLFDERLDWTFGGYYYKTYTHYVGYISLGTYGLWGEALGIPGIPFGFDNNDKFDNESKSVFAHGILNITDKLSLTGGARFTDESKIFAFDHNQLFTIAEPLEYGGKHWDWKWSLDYQFTEDIMAYATMATGFRSQGANPRPYTRAQLISTPDEEILMYELGAKTQFFDNRLRVNAAAFYNDYDPRVTSTFAYQCTDPLGTDPGEPDYTGTCPEGTYAAGGPGQLWVLYLSAPGVSKGVELDIAVKPFRNVDLNASAGWYNYETDVAPGTTGYIDPDYKSQPEWSFNWGAQYKYNFKGGSMLIPRIDMFYQGMRNNSDPAQKPVAPYHEIPAYVLWNARMTYMTADAHWSLSLEAQNLLNKLYWISLVSDRSQDLSTLTYSRTGQPGRPRTFALTLRYNIF